MWVNWHSHVIIKAALGASGPEVKSYIPTAGESLFFPAVAVALYFISGICK